MTMYFSCKGKCFIQLVSSLLGLIIGTWASKSFVVAEVSELGEALNPLFAP